jgi:hypothetical protein
MLARGGSIGAALVDADGASLDAVEVLADGAGALFDGAAEPNALASVDVRSA